MTSAVPGALRFLEAEWEQASLSLGLRLRLGWHDDRHHGERMFPLLSMKSAFSQSRPRFSMYCIGNLVSQLFTVSSKGTEI